MAQATHDLAIKTGEYQDASGQTKGRWQRIGTVFRHDDGGTSIKLDCIPVGLPDWNGWVSVFKREDRTGQGQGQYPGQGQGQSYGQGPRPTGPAPAPQPGYAGIDDDIPF
ncbi:MAG: hypothetical protein H7842_12365 [Gammaproteobacteria bacterium SHHR-1]